MTAPASTVWLIWKTNREGWLEKAHAVRDGRPQCNRRPKKDAITAPEGAPKCGRCQAKLEGRSFGQRSRRAGDKRWPEKDPNKPDPKTLYNPRFTFEKDWETKL